MTKRWQPDPKRHLTALLMVGNTDAMQAQVIRKPNVAWLKSNFPFHFRRCQLEDAEHGYRVSGFKFSVSQNMGMHRLVKLVKFALSVKAFDSSVSSHRFFVRFPNFRGGMLAADTQMLTSAGIPPKYQRMFVVFAQVN